MQRRAFTLTDILLSIAIAAILLVNSIAIATIFHNSTAIRTQQSVYLLLTEASTRSRYGIANSNWGAHIQKNATTNRVESVTLFAGDTYATRNNTHDVVTEIDQAIIASITLVNVSPYPVGNGTEIIFEKGTGDPHQTGTIMLTTNNAASTVTISATGTILYAR